MTNNGNKDMRTLTKLMLNSLYGKGNKDMRTLSKLMLNSLYGKNRIDELNKGGN